MEEILLAASDFFLTRPMGRADLLPGLLNFGSVSMVTY